LFSRGWLRDWHIYKDYNILVYEACYPNLKHFRFSIPMGKMKSFVCAFVGFNSLHDHADEDE
jgi:hypothetical protein